ncbi:MAG: hypothetical protein ACRD9S_24690 [Pyrinomonadaceae bacterium]
MNPKDKTDRERLKELVKQTPKQVFLALYLSVALGMLLGLRGIFLRMSQGAFSGKSLMFTLLVFGFFTVNGLSLLSRSRWAYVSLAIFSLLPLLGSLAGAVHLLALLVTGSISNNAVETMASAVALLQLIVIVALLSMLLSSATRSYVWSSAASSGPPTS